MGLRPNTLWCPCALAHNWWTPVARAGFSIQMDTKEIISERLQQLCKRGLLDSGEIPAIERFHEGSISGVVGRGEDTVQVDVFYDTEGWRESIASWWIDIEAGSSLVKELARIFMASGARYYCGLRACKIVYLFPSSGIYENWEALVRPFVHGVRSTPIAGSDKTGSLSSFMCRFGEVFFASGSAHIYTGPAIHPRTLRDCHFLAIDYDDQRVPSSSLAAIENALLENGAELLTPLEYLAKPGDSR